MEIEVKRLRDEITTLTAAIEEAIEEAMKKGHKSLDSFNNNPRSLQFANKDFSYSKMSINSTAIGWVDDF